MDQQILITRLRSNLAISTDASSGASVDAGASRTSDRRPYSIPLVGHHCRYGPIRRVHNCFSSSAVHGRGIYQLTSVDRYSWSGLFMALLYFYVCC